MLCLLSASSLCLWCVALEYGSISRFWGVFRGFYGADVYLYGLRSLRGLCGFCARVELGGLKSCGVFAPVFSFCPLLFFFFAYLQGLCFVILFLSSLPALFVLVSLWVFVCVVVSFSLSDYTQKERARRVGASSLRGLLFPLLLFGFNS